jgi:hypothetical protein
MDATSPLVGARSPRPVCGGPDTLVCALANAKRKAFRVSRLQLVGPSGAVLLVLALLLLSAPAQAGPKKHLPSTG